MSDQRGKLRREVGRGKNADGSTIRRFVFGIAVSTLSRCLCSGKDPVGGLGRIPESVVEYLVLVASSSTVILDIIITMFYLSCVFNFLSFNF
jgi:hypothetical protein